MYYINFVINYRYIPLFDMIEKREITIKLRYLL